MVLIQPTVFNPLLNPKGLCSAYRLTLVLPLRSQQDDFSAFVKYFVPILFPLEVLLGLIVSSFFLQEDEILESRGCLGLDFHLLHCCSAQHLTSAP